MFLYVFILDNLLPTLHITLNVSYNSLLKSENYDYQYRFIKTLVIFYSLIISIFNYIKVFLCFLEYFFIVF